MDMELSLSNEMAGRPHIVVCIAIQIFTSPEYLFNTWCFFFYSQQKNTNKMSAEITCFHSVEA